MRKVLIINENRKAWCLRGAPRFSYFINLSTIAHHGRYRRGGTGWRGGLEGWEGQTGGADWWGELEGRQVRAVREVREVREGASFVKVAGAAGFCYICSL